MRHMVNLESVNTYEGGKFCFFFLRIFLKKI